MSKAIDPHYLSEDDIVYIQQRPQLRREFILQGLGDPLDEDYPGRISNQTDGEQPPSGDGDDNDPDNDPDNPDAGDGDDEEDEGEDNEPIELSEDEQWDKDTSKSGLERVIEARNEGRNEESEWFIRPTGSNKPDLVAALEADDQRITEYNESLNQE